ncbi:uncharacterized protein [Eurosta solidaginis]|uniref:uncharacterized protein isoform X2 n=1 Tax=Eurosta solidaginis TaxID=178769 RepID=UPI0035315D98
MSSGREEGEIDSEEDGLRKRINELEEENAKYEKIKGFTDCYMDKYGHMHQFNDYNDFEAEQRAGQVPTDVSSISSVEFQTPKKKKHKRNKKGKCKVHARRSNRCTHQRQKHCKTQLHEEKRRHHHHHHNRERVVLNPYYEQPGIEIISLDSTDMSDYDRDNYSIAAMEIESPDESYNTTLPLSREELRLALGRGAAERKNNVCSLKERLQPDKLIPIDNEENEDKDEKVQTFQNATANLNENIDNVVEIDSDNSISLEEHELRLIALRSAIMKKHATRKKRNAEIAYSPTDFDDLVVEPISVVDSEIEELHGDMELSPASSPHLLLSPIHCDDEQNSNISLETVDQQIDTKPIDMDIVSSDSEREDNGSNMVDIADCLQKPATHDIPLPPDAPPMKGVAMQAMAFNYVNHNSGIAAFDMYMHPTIHYSTPMDMPQTMLPMPPTPPAPPLITTTANDIQPLPITNEIAVNTFDNDVKNEVPNRELIITASPKSASMDIIAEDTQDEPPDGEGSGEDEEEAEALRALLLSQRQMAKAAKANGMPRLRKPSPAQEIPQIIRHHSPKIASLDVDRLQENNTIIKALPLQLPVLQVNKPLLDTKPTESILKEALRRLKVKKSIQPREDPQQVCEKHADNIQPRLTIKPFARCKELGDEEETVVLAHAEAHNLIVNESSQSNDSNKHSMQQQEDTRSSFELESHKRSAPEILGTHATSIENTQKRRLENEMSKAGRTLRIIELRQDIEYSSSQHSSEGSSNNVELEKAGNAQSVCVYEKPSKKFKTSTNEQLNHTQKATSIISVNGKERIQESASNKERNSSASGEKENKELLKEVSTKSDVMANVIANVIANVKPNAVKPVKKLARAAVEKRKVSQLTFASATKTTITTTTNQPAKNAAPSQKKTVSAAPRVPSLVANPISKQLKIVKPNKVINKHLHTSNDTQTITEASTQSRVLTSSKLPNIKVNKLIIRVGGDVESSSEDEEILRHQTLERCIRLTTARTATPDSLTGILNENFYSSKVSSNSQQQQQLAEMPNDDISNLSLSAQQDAVMSAATEAFEKKLEDFLKNMRSKTQSKTNSSVEHARVRKISSSSKQTGTPTAVRSLPTASQEEYKRLVHRMKILEKQKQLKKMQKALLEDAEKYSKNKKDSATQKLKKTKEVIFSETATQTSNDASSMGGYDQEAKTIENDAVESTEKCESRKTDSNEVAAANVQIAKAEAVKANLALTAKLQTCEKIVTNISNNIIKRLDKSLQLVNDAKLSKIAKMRHEQRIKELRLEMDQTQRKMKEEQIKMSRIYPEICANNEFITNLKQKRAKVLEMAMKLGRRVKGDDYSLLWHITGPNEQTQIITVYYTEINSRGIICGVGKQRIQKWQARMERQILGDLCNPLEMSDESFKKLST